MQLASSGARTLRPGGTMLHMHNPVSRAIHIPSFAPRPQSAQAKSITQQLFRHTRTLISNFVTHLTTPGTLRLPGQVPSTARSIYHGSSQLRSIQQSFSLPTRYALSRPLQAPHLPRAPAVPRGVSQVGLGLTRNFSTGRPIFQNIAENVPVSGRAFWEADWDTNVSKERENTKIRRHKAKQERKNARKSMAKPLRSQSSRSNATTDEKKDLDLYFPVETVPGVTTHLLIPLAPTQASRLPLPEVPSLPMAHPLLPYQLLSSLHSAHSTHALRVQSLFARLETAQVFTFPGVRCEAHGDPSGLCTLLEITFEGWDAALVRSVIGEAGQGWCLLEEERADEEQHEKAHMDAMLEAMSADDEASWASGEPYGAQFHQVIDPARSLVLPTLDFAASFPVESTPAFRSPPSDLEFHNAWSSMTRDQSSRSASDSLLDVLSDPDSGDWGSSLSSASTERSWVNDDDFRSESHVNEWPSLSPTDSSWFGFSSAFVGRMERPMEELF